MQNGEKQRIWTLPIRDEALIDNVAYSRWVRSEAEDADAYVRRRKVIDLAQIVRDAIRDELNETQREAILLRYYENRTPQQIAEMLHIGLPAVSKRLSTAEEKLRSALKYVIRYQYDMRHLEVLPCAVREALVTAAGRYGRSADMGARIVRLREGEHLTLDMVAYGTHIAPERLQQIESGAEPPDCAELVRLSAYFDVSADSILKGVSA